MKSLDAINRLCENHLVGNETFSYNGEESDMTILDFWRWHFSELYNMQNTIAEFIVARALGLTEAYNAGDWTLFDMEYRSKRIEVKETSYMHAWQTDSGQTIPSSTPTGHATCHGKYKKRQATIPVLKNTPSVFIDYCHIDADRTFVMSARKAYKAMRGNDKRQHNLGVDGMMRVIEKLHTPDCIVYQNVGPNAGHYAAIVSINNGETVAAVDIGDYRSGNDSINGEDGFYNVLITAFNADDGYIDNNILDERNDIVYDSSVDKKHEIPESVAYSETLTDSHSEISNNNIRTYSAKSQDNSSKQQKPVRDTKQAQFDIIQQANPAEDDYHTWIRDEPKSQARTFGITKAYEKYQDNTSAFERQNDIYVFCLNTGETRETSNPLKLENWEFYVVPTSVINEQCGNAKTISLPRLRKITKALAYPEIKGTIDAIIENGM